MAIAYKSQGAGAATETSAAACSPASPATVDAGDILIVHAYFEGTATTPDTPAGFTLLSGPHVVQSTIGRHWVYGKIAGGTEDGAANALGTQAVTTMRSGRCYSFSGRVAGTITDLVRGFAATSHATDPQMPTVTTTVAGALAVALVLQNDNNSLASATGETGGDWVEAVAEFTAALTPGLVLQIQTATPTANPGTISGGAVAATNDPAGVVGFEIRPQAAEYFSGTLVVDGGGVLAVATSVRETFSGQTVVTGDGVVTIASSVREVLAGQVEITGAGNITIVDSIVTPGGPTEHFSGQLVVDGGGVLSLAASVRETFSDLITISGGGAITVIQSDRECFSSAQVDGAGSIVVVDSTVSGTIVEHNSGTLSLTGEGTVTIRSFMTHQVEYLRNADVTVYFGQSDTANTRLITSQSGDDPHHFILTET